MTVEAERTALPDHECHQVVEQDRRFLWHPWTPQNEVERPVLVAGAGAVVYDARGREYVDARAASMTMSCGYGRADIAEAIATQARLLANYDLKGFTTLPAVRLAARYAALMPDPLSRTFFANSGSEATEAAIKLARMYHALRGVPSRKVIVAFDEGYHGATLGAANCTASPAVRGGFGPTPGGFATLPAPRGGLCGPHLPHGDCSASCADALDALMQRIGAENVAAVVMEPVLGLAGVVLPPAGYLRRVREICTAHGVLLVLDEVMTGFARTGAMFAFEHAGVVADVVTTGKGVTGGYLPLAAMTTTEEIFAAFTADDLLGGFRHGHTTSGHATACAAALAALNVIESECLAERASWLGAFMRDDLAALVAHPFVHEVRGLGLLIGIEVDTTARAETIASLAQARGVLVVHRGNVITVAPPLVISEELAARIGNVLAECCDTLTNGGGL